MSATFVVAVVDDDYRVLESLENLLQSAGYVVHAFASAPALLKSSLWSELHLLITDIGMSSIDGFALRSQLQRDRPGVPVILITGSVDLLRAAEAEGPKKTPIFFKPFDAAQLLHAIEGMLGR